MAARRLSLAALGLFAVPALFAAGCVQDGDRPARQAAAAPALRTILPQELVGLGPADVQALLGPPELRRVEAMIEVWQYRSERCVLDLYLYPGEGGGPAAADGLVALAGGIAVAHLETRPRSSRATQPRTAPHRTATSSTAPPAPCSDGVLQTRQPAAGTSA